MKKITVEVSDTVYALLNALAETPNDSSAAIVVAQLIDHAQQGVYRPGAWERDWLCRAFGYYWLERLEPGDPYGRPEPSEEGISLFERPKART